MTVILTFLLTSVGSTKNQFGLFMKTTAKLAINQPDNNRHCAL